MPRVQIWGSLRAGAGGAEEVEVEAASIGEMLECLATIHPGLRPQIERGVSVSVDGLIFRDSWLTPILPDSEVVLLPKLTGG